MLHTPIPDRIASIDEQRLPPAIGIAIALGSSALLWGALYAGYILAF